MVCSEPAEAATSSCFTSTCLSTPHLTALHCTPCCALAVQSHPINNGSASCLDDVRICGPALAELHGTAAADFPPALLAKQLNVLVSCHRTRAHSVTQSVTHRLHATQFQCTVWHLYEVQCCALAIEQMQVVEPGSAVLPHLHHHSARVSRIISGCYSCKLERLEGSPANSCCAVPQPTALSVLHAAPAHSPLGDDAAAVLLRIVRGLKRSLVRAASTDLLTAPRVAGPGVTRHDGRQGIEGEEDAQAAEAPAPGLMQRGGGRAVARAVGVKQEPQPLPVPGEEQRCGAPLLRFCEGVVDVTSVAFTIALQVRPLAPGTLIRLPYGLLRCLPIVHLPSSPL